MRWRSTTTTTRTTTTAMSTTTTCLNYQLRPALAWDAGRGNSWMQFLKKEKRKLLLLRWSRNVVGLNGLFIPTPRKWVKSERIMYLWVCMKYAWLDQLVTPNKKRKKLPMHELHIPQVHGSSTDTSSNGQTWYNRGERHIQSNTRQEQLWQRSSKLAAIQYHM